MRVGSELTNRQSVSLQTDGRYVKRDRMHERALNKKVEQGQATRQEIVATATKMFARHGYAETSIEAVLAASAVSRGALYHHFAGKEALFEAVFEAIEAEVAQKILAKSRRAKGAIETLRAGCEAWLELAREDAVRQIVLIDAPSVLGWEKWREIDARHGFGLLKASLAAASAKGAIPPALVENFAHMLLAALVEVALIIARADDAAAATKAGKAAVQELLTRLLRAA
jgi:AcrR family transcriptional regulator